MLGIIGFISAAVVFSIYAYSFNKIKIRKKDVDIEFYQFAYLLLAICCVFWVAGIIKGTTSGLILSVLLANISLLIGTMALAYGMLPHRYKIPAVIVLILFSIGFITARTIWQIPEPEVFDGILVFNTSTEISAALGLLFVAVWLPSSYFVTRLVTEKKYFRPLRAVGLVSVVLAIFGLFGFLAADTTQTLVLSFGVIVCAFAPLTAINFLVRRGVK